MPAGQTSSSSSSPPAPSSPPSTSTSTSTSISRPPPATSAASAPSISLTPATPDTALGPSLPRPLEQPDSPPAASTSAVPSPPALPAIAEKDSSAGKMPPATGNASTAVPASSNTKPSGSQPAASTSAAAAAAPPRAGGAKKKRKRKGFAAFLLALGCLSASEFEDEPPKGVKQGEKEKIGKETTTPTTTTSSAAVPAPVSTSEKSPATGTGAVAGVTKSGAQEKSKEAEKTPGLESRQVASAALAGAAVAGGATLTGAAVGAKDSEAETERARENERLTEVLSPPSEPVSPPVEETAGVTSSAVQPPGSGSELLQTTPSRPSVHRRESGSGTPADKTSSGGYTEALQTEASDTQGHDDSQLEEGDAEYQMEDEYEDEEDRLIAQGGIGIPIDEFGNPSPLLPAVDKIHTGRKCLVLDLDETLLHSSFKMLPSADYIVPVEIESQTHNVYVIKRPGVDHFLKEMGKVYEVVVFTASLSKYADPVLDMLDPAGVVKHRLFRESCYNHKGNYVKDLSQLGRTMESCIIIDNSPASYIFHPNNAVPVSTWFNDPHDTELTDLVPFLTDLATVDDIRGVLDGSI